MRGEQRADRASLEGASDLRLCLASAATAGSSGILSLIAAPVLVSAVLAGMAATERAAGAVTSLELVTVALTSFVVAPLMGRWPRRTLALAGAVLAITGHAMSTQVTDMGQLMPARVLAGLGGGLMVAAGNATVASARDPDRVYSLVVLATALTQLVVVSLGPILVARWSFAGAYAMQGVFVVLMLGLVVLMPQHALLRPHASAATATATEDGPPLPAVLAVCCMIALYFVRDASLWSFSQEIGTRAGLAREQVGVILGMTGIVAVLGAVAAATLSTRWGRVKPLMFGLLTNTVLAFWISQTRDPWVFTIVEYLYHFVLFFTVPYMYGLAAALDRRGRAIAAAGGAMLFGGALGPGIGGVMISWGGYPALGGLILVAMTLAMVLALWLQHRVEGRGLARAAVRGR